MKALCHVCGKAKETAATLGPQQIFVCGPTVQQRQAIADGQEIMSPCRRAAYRWWDMQ